MRHVALLVLLAASYALGRSGVTRAAAGYWEWTPMLAAQTAAVALLQWAVLLVWRGWRTRSEPSS